MTLRKLPRQDGASLSLETEAGQVFHVTRMLRAWFVVDEEGTVYGAFTSAADVYECIDSLEMEEA